MCIRDRLTCAYQATRNSGPVTRNAARTVAEAVGAEYFELDIDGLVQGYIDAAVSYTHLTLPTSDLV